MFEKIMKKIVKTAGPSKEIDEQEIIEIVGEALSSDELEKLFKTIEEKFSIQINSDKRNDEPDEISLSDLEEEDIDNQDLNITSSNNGTEYDDTTDPVRMYLKEIGKIPLLKSDEEKKLGKAISIFKEAKEEMEKFENEEIEIDLKRQKQLKRYIQKGEAAARKLTEANYRLVVALAKKYEKSTSSMVFLDLIQEGNLGLMRAVEKFDYKKGFKFSTYATWWIKQGITRSIAEKSRTIRIPVHMNETINKMNKAKRILIQELGREPSEQEIVDRVNKLDQKQKLTVEKMRYIKNISPNPLSLETPVGEEAESSFGDLISDQRTPNPHQNMVDETIMSVLSDALKDNLTDREEKVLRMRTGLYDGHEYTLEEVGLEFNVTRERIRQIENKAKAKLRKPEQKKLFLSVLKRKK